MKERQHSARIPAWPRLLDSDLAAAYLGVSTWTLREFEASGEVARVEVPRPPTARANKHRPSGDKMRLLLFDRLDLDSLIDRWKEQM